ncbi:MAG: cupin domain-containing protein [Alphaproteobacteria bacterium]|nr:cupin domain-containing protein [Alphaproteobacteria bacterium]
MSLPETINLNEAYSSVTAQWTPKILAQVNDQYVKIAKIQNEFVWHKHDDSDELFFIVKGELKMQYEGRDVMLKQGDIHVVPKGVMHNPYAQNECYVMFIETTDTAHTGDVVTDRTIAVEDQAY